MMAVNALFVFPHLGFYCRRKDVETRPEITIYCWGNAPLTGHFTRSTSRIVDIAIDFDSTTVINITSADNLIRRCFIIW